MYDFEDSIIIVGDYDHSSDSVKTKSDNNGVSDYTILFVILKNFFACHLFACVQRVSFLARTV